MPHVNSSGGDDLASTDEVKVYHDEGEEEQRSSENLSEDKLGLVIETEEEKSSTLPSGSRERNPTNDKNGGLHLPTNSIGHIGYVVTPYPYPNGATVPSSLGGKMGMVSPSHPGLGLVMYNNDHFSSPPPAHMGIPPVHIDPKTGLPRASMLPFGPPPGQFPHPLYSPEFSQVQWQSSPGYPITTAAFRSPYSTGLVPNSALARFSPPGVFPHAGLGPPGMSPPAIITPGPKQEIPVSLNSLENHRQLLHVHERSGIGQSSEPPQEKKKPHIKKPLNAFMLFMKENRAKVVAECTLKESAAINQILGRRWHALDRAEQAKYYEMARKEKELHLQLYPGWSARDNYAIHTKKKKRKKECLGESKDGVYGARVLSPGECGPQDCQNPKKCRARFGLDQQNEWCKPCRRKKRCIRFLGGDGDDDDEDEDLSDCDHNIEDSIKWEPVDQDGTVHSSSQAGDDGDSNDRHHNRMDSSQSEQCSSRGSPLLINLPTTSSDMGSDTKAISVTT